MIELKLRKRKTIIIISLLSLSLSSSPTGHLSGLISTAMIRLAPTSLHPMITASPTAPQPNMATFEPDSTPAEGKKNTSSKNRGGGGGPVFRTAPYPVGIPQPNRHILSNEAAALTCS